MKQIKIYIAAGKNQLKIDQWIKNKELKTPCYQKITNDLITKWLLGTTNKKKKAQEEVEAFLIEDLITNGYNLIIDKGEKFDINYLKFILKILENSHIEYSIKIKKFN